MATPTLITELSTTAAANAPAGSDSPSTLDDIQRAHASFIAQLRDADALKLNAAAVSAFGLTLVDDASAAAARTTLGAASSGANADITSLTSPNGSIAIKGVSGGYAGRTIFGDGQRGIRKESTSHNLELVNEANTAVTHVFGNDGSMLSNGTGGLGYAPGAGGTVTQATSRTTAVTLNKPTGQITMFTASASPTPETFSVNNSLVGANDTVVVTLKSGASNNYIVTAFGVTSGAFGIQFYSAAGVGTDTPVLTFAIIKGAVA